MHRALLLALYSRGGDSTFNNDFHFELPETNKNKLVCYFNYGAVV